MTSAALWFLSGFMFGACVKIARIGTVGEMVFTAVVFLVCVFAALGGME